MWHFAGYAAGAVALVGAGYWLHYKFGSTVAADVAKGAAAIAGAAGKISGSRNTP